MFYLHEQARGFLDMAARVLLTNKGDEIVDGGSTSALENCFLYYKVVHIQMQLVHGNTEQSTDCSLEKQDCRNYIHETRVYSRAP